MWQGGEGVAACLKASWAAASLKADPRDGWKIGGGAARRGPWTVDEGLSGGNGHSSQSEA
jgi:hypothetical protein